MVHFSLRQIGLLPFFRIWGSSNSESSLNCSVLKIPNSFFAMVPAFPTYLLCSFWYYTSQFFLKLNFKNKFLDQNCIINWLMVSSNLWIKRQFWYKKFNNLNMIPCLVPMREAKLWCKKIGILGAPYFRNFRSPIIRKNGSAPINHASITMYTTENAFRSTCHHLLT